MRNKIPSVKVIIKGSKFGALTVIDDHDPECKLRACRCQCGNESLVNPEYLLNGMIQYCDFDEDEINKHAA